ncbi:DUF4124 domain-containing protein [Thiohalomonas denitrificans]|uniref:DUF4124 domain-containing protein n=1 Tax=Thiohalomonas denitrificans TaxID=415747 RepID=UPI0026EA600C|nr:DUF4124 domain-containing protein [Thiohalomonas denitrificans]
MDRKLSRRRTGANGGILALVLLLASGAAGAGNLYRWTDANGVTHFGDKPGPGASAVEVGPLNGYRAPPVPASSDPKLKEAAGQPKVVMYGTEWCGICKKARAYLGRNSISYTEYDVEKSARGKRDYRRMNGSGVPIFLVGGQRLNGFSEERFERLLDTGNQ